MAVDPIGEPTPDPARSPGAPHAAARPVAAPTIGAVVLAGGRSSRMGSLKPLLPLGPALTIERVVANLRSAGITRIVVVTGHEGESVAPVLKRLGVERAHNAGYDSGMFSSVRTGVAALPAGLEAFLVLPVDCPLVTARALRALLAGFAASGKGIVYPTCFGRRGHPPVLASRYARPLLDFAPDGDLAGFLGTFTDDQAEVDVRDLTVLMDMDTPTDHRILSTFAAALDSAQPGGARTGGPEPPIGEDEALFLLAAAGTPANIVRHCRTSAAVGERFATALEPLVPGLDVALVRAGCLLHDIARVLPHHATLAAEVLANLGLPRLGAVVGRHMVLGPGLPGAEGITEAELVYLADKMVADGEVVGLDERQARAGRKLRSEPGAVARIAERIADARAIHNKVGVFLGRPAAEALAGLVLPEGCAPTELRVYLVRHARPKGPGGRRYRGQADAPLGAEGEQQARALADRLMALTGGACFDAVVSSDLSRCVRTAEIAGEGCGTSAVIVPWLREIDVGLWEGLTWEEAQARYPAEYAARERAAADQRLAQARFPGGESFVDVAARVLPPFERLLEESLAASLRRLLVVGHKGVDRVIMAHFRGLPLEELFSMEQDFCAVTVLRVSSGPGGAGQAGDRAGGWRVTAVDPR